MKEASRKTAIQLFTIRFFRLLVSVATLSIAARFFGVGMERESWILSLNFVLVLNLALWGPLNETFRAKFIFLKASEGESVAIKRAGSLLVLTLLVLCPVVLLFEIYSLALAKMIAPAYSAEALNQVSILLRYLLWSAIITQSTQLLSSILNTYDSFFIPEICGFVSALINLSLIMILSNYVGIYSFVIANYVSLFLLLFALIYQIRKLKIPLFHDNIILSWAQVKPFIIFSIPFFLPYIIGQCNGLIEKSISNVLGNSAVSIIDYSKKITDIIQTVLSSVLVTIMVPVLSSKFSGGNLKIVADESQKYLQLIYLMLAFFIPILIVCAEPVSDILYNKGSITQQDLQKIALLIRLYAISLIAIFTYLVFGLILLSINKNKQYAFYGMIAQILMIIINFVAYKKFGIFTFVIALTISHLLTAGILFFKLPFPRFSTGICLLRYGSLILCVSLTSILVNQYLYTPGNAYINIIYNVILVLLSALCFAVLLQLSEVRLLQQYLSKFNKK